MITIRKVAVGLGITLLLAAGAAGAAFTEADMEKLARQRYGENLRAFEPSEDPFWAARLKGHQVYAVDVFNPQSHLAGRAILWRTWGVLPDGKTMFIESIGDAVEFLGRIKLSSKTDLKIMTEMLARLLRVRILTKPGDLGEGTKEEQVIQPPVYDTVGEERHAGFYVLADPVIFSVLKIDLYLSGTNKLRFTAEVVSSRREYD